MPKTTSSTLASAVAGHAIRRARRAVGVTQAELAQRIGVSAPYISGLESGKGNPTIGQLWALADALRVELHIELKTPAERPLPRIPEPPAHSHGSRHS